MGSWMKVGEGIKQKSIYTSHKDTDNSVAIARRKGGRGWREVEVGKAGINGDERNCFG